MPLSYFTFKKHTKKTYKYLGVGEQLFRILTNHLYFKMPRVLVKYGNAIIITVDLTISLYDVANHRLILNT